MKLEKQNYPESIHILLWRSFKVYRASFFHVFFLSLLLSIIAFIPRLLSTLVGQDVFLGLPTFSPQRLWLLMITLGTLIFFTALLWRIRCVITDTHESIMDDMKISLRKIPFIFVAAILNVGGILITTYVVGALIYSMYFINIISFYRKA